MLPEFFPAGTEFADVQGVPVSCTRNGSCRAWDRNPDRHFSVESFIYKGLIVTEAAFRELHRRRKASRLTSTITASLIGKYSIPGAE